MTSSVKKFCHVWKLVPSGACVPVNSWKVNGAAKQFALLSGWPWKHRLQQEDLAAGSTGTVGIYQPRGPLAWNFGWWIGMRRAYRAKASVWCMTFFRMAEPPAGFLRHMQRINRTHFLLPSDFFFLSTLQHPV